ncbi:hypothetical protein POVWA1_028460 [Plasmodium ovale wallikeri]|uniref:Uncharacterized protein n=1 Tax=Plasmodium ovale wallikeri TaxID=864142 RepID=A0A1A8YW09_PLAOA|nr:hypothetical protein POVWA1_028460 [Plasmodium ovale wallikeri]
MNIFSTVAHTNWLFFLFLLCVQKMKTVISRGTQSFCHLFDFVNFNQLAFLQKGGEKSSFWGKNHMYQHLRIYLCKGGYMRILKARRRYMYAICHYNGYELRQSFQNAQFSKEQVALPSLSFSHPPLPYYFWASSICSSFPLFCFSLPWPLCFAPFLRALCCCDYGNAVTAETNLLRAWACPFYPFWLLFPFPVFTLDVFTLAVFTLAVFTLAVFTLASLYTRETTFSLSVSPPRCFGKSKRQKATVKKWIAYWW